MKNVNDPKTTKIELYDSSLRDGTQSEHISYSIEDKVQIAQRLDELQFDFIEGGWPGSNPKDIGFFEQLKKIKFSHAKSVAFGSTRHVKNKPSEDPNLIKLVEAETPVITIFGKTWDLHVTDALRVDLDMNLDMIASSLEYLKPNCEILMYDAEHFFDGYKRNSDYAMKTLEKAVEGGAERLVLCDTNGGSLTEEIFEIVTEVRKRFAGVALGIHAHNDSGLAVANSLAGISAGCIHVQGTINGFGERCGNADLTTIIANLRLKMGYEAIPEKTVKGLTTLSRFVYEIGNLRQRDNQPFVGASAFAHKGGIHVSAVMRNPETYEHVPPEEVGNERRVLISELSGRSNLLAKVGGKFNLKDNPEKTREVLDTLMERENYGYNYEAARASFEILVMKALGLHREFFSLEGFRVITDLDENGREYTEATLKLIIHGQMEHTAAEGNGPVNALDSALRKALLPFYPELSQVNLADYKVRVINAGQATAARVLVQITSTDGKGRWTTVGASENIIEASWLALVDSIDYKLLFERMVFVR